MGLRPAVRGALPGHRVSHSDAEWLESVGGALPRGGLRAGVPETQCPGASGFHELRPWPLGGRRRAGALSRVDAPLRALSLPGAHPLVGHSRADAGELSPLEDRRVRGGLRWRPDSPPGLRDRSARGLLPDLPLISAVTCSETWAMGEKSFEVDPSEPKDRIGHAATRRGDVPFARRASLEGEASPTPRMSGPSPCARSSRGRRGAPAPGAARVPP